MLIRLLFNNVLSFRDGTEFNLLPNPRKKRLGHHVYPNLGIPVVKATAIYGANGAGKSNILKGARLLKDIVLEKDFITEYNVYNDSRFLLQENKKDPMSFAAEYSIEGDVFLYHIDVLRDKITKEELYHIQPDGDDTPIFIAEVGLDGNRSLRVFEDNGVENLEYVDEKTITFLKQNPSSSVMSLHTTYPILRGELVEKAYSWFKKGLSVVSLSILREGLVELMDTNAWFLQFSNDITTTLLSDIGALHIRTRKLNELSQREKDLIMATHRGTEEWPSTILYRKNGIIPTLAVSEKEGELIAKDIVLSHKGPYGYTCDMTLDSQSEGTKQLIAKMPALAQAFLADTTVFIDEIENGSHPLLIQQLLQIFLDKKDTKGQLIFTTHEVLLLDQKHIRADEVWFAEKEEGCSKLYSLNDFKEHQTIDIAKGYLNGRYGAIPFYSGETVLNTPTEDEE